MCGIAGVMYRDPERTPDPERLAAMAAIQHHRGPDGFGWKVVDGRGVGFSHARLSIIDLDVERGRQPFFSPGLEAGERGRMVTHNGEFYDYKRLRADLASRGHVFRTKSDTELLLHLAERFGLEDALTHLRGEFAFAVYERDPERLVLVRDRFGVKPLYWARTDDAFVFGSEIKVLFAHPAVPRRFDDAGALHQLMQTMVPGTTAFAGVHAVEPGQMVIVERRDGRLHVRTRQYWDLDYPRAAERGPAPPDEAAFEELRARLVEAIQLRLEADVPVACYLSGGIDSCSIISIAANVQQSPVKAFTIGFDDADYDETHIAREMAAAVGADQDVLTVRGDQLYDHFVDTVWHTERSLYNTLCVAKLHMSRHVHEAGYKVVVTGEGSDELFAGYPQLRMDMILHGMDGLPDAERADLHAWLEESNAMFKGNLLAAKPLDDPDLAALVGFTPSCLQSWLSCAPRARSLLHPDRRAAVRDYRPGAGIAAALDAAQLEGRHPLDKAQYVWTKTQFESQVLGWAGDRVDMANSMEARPAFLDHHLAEWAVGLPPSLRIRGRADKFVLRETMKPVLPASLYARQKFAFMAPPAHTDDAKARAMRALADEHLSPAAVREAGLLDLGAVRAVFAAHDDPRTPPAQRVQLDAVINHMLSVQVLHRQLVATDVPAQAQARARALGWSALRN